MYLTYIIILILITIMFNITEVNNYILALIILLLLLLNELYNCSINENYLSQNNELKNSQKQITDYIKAIFWQKNN
jgi:hypothetical protein